MQIKRQQAPRSSIAGQYDCSQWHVCGPSSVNTHIIPTWEAGFLGAGSLITVVDDGLEWRHPDIQPGYSATHSTTYHRFGSSTDPRPAAGNTHGTAASGVAAARGATGVPPATPTCGHGVAPMADIAGINLIEGAVTDATEARALAYHCASVSCYSCSWGPADSGLVVEEPGLLARAAVHYSAVHGRNGLGSLYVWAAGNGRDRGDNCAYDGYIQQADVMAIGAVTHLGRAASYSEACPAVYACAPSSGDGLGITTMDVPTTTNGNNMCRNNFGGTSSATPFVAGVVALIESANPTLTAREIMEVIARSARVIDPDHTSWITNGVGYRYSTLYGFGLVDAQAAVLLARRMPANTTHTPHTLRQFALRMRWYQSTVSLRPPYTTALSMQTSQAMAHMTANNKLPCAISSGAGVATVVWTDVAERDLLLARAEVTVSVTHPRRSELSFALESPMRTRFVIPPRDVDTMANLYNWTFAFVGFRGEHAAGRWSFIAADVVSGTRRTGVIQDVVLTLIGEHA